VIADTTGELSRAFGVLEDDGTALHGAFVIDPDRVLRHASVSAASVGHGPAAILATLQGLRAAEPALAAA
jgi:alkyl hydroperoxide reductase subunit AhpC